MIIGTGIDIIEVARVYEKVQRSDGFRDKVFSAAEIAYCESKANPAEHYAARFAAKESFLKATGRGLLTGFDLYEIEIISDNEGKPEIILTGKMKAWSAVQPWKKIHVSISHVALVACASVIIEG